VTKEKWFIILVMVVVFVDHASFINNGFTWLDHGDIEAGRAVLPVAKLPRAFFTRFGETGFYRPAVTILNSIDAFFYGKSPQGYHLTNVLLHVAVSIASFFFALTFFELSYIESSIVALIVGVHPLSILPVGAISYRQELLVVMFTFVAVSAHIKTRRTGKIIWIAGSIFFWTAALFSKETALFWIPTLIFLWEWTKGFKKLRQHSLYIVTFILVAVLYGIFRLQAVPEIWRSVKADLSLSGALGTRLSMLTQRLTDIFNPTKPAFSDAVLVKGMVSWHTWLAILSIVAGVVITFKSKRRSIVTRLAFFVLIALIPALSIVPLPRFNSPHYSFIAIPVVGMIVVLIGRQVVRRFGNLGKALFVLLVGIWIFFMAVSTFTAGFQFKDDLRLFGPEVKRDDNFREGHFYLGDYYLRRENYQLAAKHLEDSLRQRPGVIAFVDRPAAMINLAGTYLSLRKIDEAQKLLREVAEKNSGINHLRSLYNLAVIADRKGAYQEIVNLLGDDIYQWQQPEPLLLFVKGLVKTGNEAGAEGILKNRLFINDYKKRQEIIQTFR